MESESPLLNLFCNENISSLNAALFKKDENMDFISVSESDREFIEISFGKEINFRPDGDKNQVEKWSKIARLEAVKWILQIRALFGYHYRTAYLSLIYFDQFLARTCFSDGKRTWTSRILSIACLSIATKMEEHKARPFSDYRVDGYNFQGNEIHRMELCVLNALEWKMAILTPFTYLNYFISNLGIEKSRHQEIVTQASDLILAIMEEINAAENRPSIVAAATVLAAYDHHLDKTMLENKIDAIPTWGSEEKELTFSCYCLLQEILMLKTPKSVITPSLLSIDNSAYTSRGGSRRRLTYDQNCPVKKNKLS
ncbi:hypothetical protein OROMI_000690 [Orobanche minor]